MNTNQNKTKTIFSMALAEQLIELGHEVLGEMPNPFNKKLTFWIFKIDETFFEDFKKLQRKE